MSVAFLGTSWQPSEFIMSGSLIIIIIIIIIMCQGTRAAKKAIISSNLFISSAKKKQVVNRGDFACPKGETSGKLNLQICFDDSPKKNPSRSIKDGFCSSEFLSSTYKEQETYRILSCVFFVVRLSPSRFWDSFPKFLELPNAFQPSNFKVKHPTFIVTHAWTWIICKPGWTWNLRAKGPNLQCRCCSCCRK